MRNISDTIARLQAGVAMATNAAAVGFGRLLPFDDFGSNPGALRAKAYVPDALPPGAPLVVILHGCTQTADGYDRGAGWSTLAEREGFAVLYPEQTHANNPNLCFNWFEPEDTKRGGGEALSISQMIAAMTARYALDRTRVFVTGLSAGGAMTSVMLATYPELFAAGAIIAGLPFGTARGVAEALDRMRGHGGPGVDALAAKVRAASPAHAGDWPTVAVWHGTADHTVTHRNMDDIAGQWATVHAVRNDPVTLDTADGHLQRVWRDARGRDVVETHAIRGMGHGTPIDPNGPDGLGAAGPHMLDVGVSSTARIAQRWGLTRPAIEVTAPPARPQREQPTRKPRPPLGARPAFVPIAEPATGIQKIIERALRTAGLMK